MKKQNLKFIYCHTLQQGVEYNEYIKKAKHIAGQLEQLKLDGFFDEDLDLDATKMAGALALFGASIEEVHVPLTKEKAAGKWDEMRSMLK